MEQKQHSDAESITCVFHPNGSFTQTTIKTIPAKNGEKERVIVKTRIVTGELMLNSVEEK
jgi:hypothetical protein